MIRSLFFLLLIVLLAGCWEEKISVSNIFKSEETTAVEIENKFEESDKALNEKMNKELQEQALEQLDEIKETISNGQLESKQKSEKLQTATEAENSQMGKEEVNEQDLTDLEELEKEVVETLQEFEEIEKYLQELDTLTEELNTQDNLDEDLAELEELKNSK